MKRKGYRKPSMMVVQLQHTGMLMQSQVSVGGTNSNRSGYGDAIEDSWD